MSILDKDSMMEDHWSSNPRFKKDTSMTRLTREQAAIIGVYTGVLVGPFGDVHKLAEDLLGRPVFTHELAEESIWEELKDLVRPQFINICAEKS